MMRAHDAFAYARRSCTDGRTDELTEKVVANGAISQVSDARVGGMR